MPCPEILLIEKITGNVNPADAKIIGHSVSNSTSHRIARIERTHSVKIGFAFIVRTWEGSFLRSREAAELTISTVFDLATVTYLDNFGQAIFSLRTRPTREKVETVNLATILQPSLQFWNVVKSLELGVCIAELNHDKNLSFELPLLYHIDRHCQGLNLNLSENIVRFRTVGIEPTFSPAPRFAIRSHAAKRVEVNLNPGVAIWSLAIKRPVVILPLYNNYRQCQALS